MSSFSNGGPGKFVRRTLTRRDMLKLSAGSGGLLLLASCVPATAPQGETAGGAAPAAEPSGPITVLLQSGSPQTLAFQEYIPEFEEETGIGVQPVEVPHGEMLQKMMVEFAADTGAYDVVAITEYWMVPGAPYLEPLDYLYTPEDMADFPEAVIEGARDREGVLRGLPFISTVIGTYYRTDLFQEKGLQPPTNWDEYLNAATELKSDTDGDGNVDIWGTVIEGTTQTATSGTKFLCWMLQAGGGLTNSAGNLIVNSPENVEALQFVSDLVNTHEVAPPEAPEMSYVEVHNMFIQGRTAMADNWQYMVRLGQDPEQSKVADQFAVVPLPERQRRGVIIGLWLFALPTSSKNKEAAGMFMKSATSTEEQVRMVSKEGIAARLSAMDPEQNPVILEYNPYLPVFAQSMAEFGVARPKWEKIDEVLRRLGQAVNRTVAGMQTPEQAMEQAHEEIAELVPEE